MPNLGSNTSALNIVNLQVMAEDQVAADKQVIVDAATGETLYDANVAANSKHYLWHGDHQTFPMGMDGNPEQFAAKLAEALPIATTLRLAFNEHSFDANGNLHEQYERFLIAAANEGFTILPIYSSGDVQRLGDPDAPGYGALSNTEAYAALQENFSDISDAWTKMLDWLESHPSVDSAVTGFELMNEPAGYRHSIRENGTGEGLNRTDFVELYADHVVALSEQIQARSSGSIFVGPWGYSGNIATLDQTTIGGMSAIDYIASGVGADLVWSVHLYPGWSGTKSATSTAELESILDSHFAPLAGYNVHVTETNIHGTADDITGGTTTADLFARSFEWFAENGIGLGWFPGAETGGSNLVVIDGAGSLRFLHQHSLAHAFNAYSLGGAPAAPTGDQTIFVQLVAGGLRNEVYEADYDAADPFDTVDHLGTAFGYDGDDTLHGTDGSNDLMYGGSGHDRLTGGQGDDFLFGQYGNDILSAAGGINHLFGGDGEDTMIGGSGYDQYTGGEGADTFRTGVSGDDVIIDFEAGTDLIDLSGAYNSYSEIQGNLSALDADGDGLQDDLVLHFQNGSTLRILDAALEQLSASDFVGLTPPSLISGDVGADYLRGGAGDDTLLGQGGNDILRGDQGADVLDGGAGSLDWVYYNTSDAAVAVDLGANTASGGHATGDSITGVERVLGSDYDDTLTGDAGANYLRGGAGDDTLSGQGGNDILRGDQGADVLDGGAGLSDWVYYNASNAAVAIDLGANTASGGHAAGDSITGVERVLGSDYDDSLTGDGSANYLRGGAGDDTLSGQGGNDILRGDQGADILDGGAGLSDWVYYNTSNAAVAVDLGANTASGGHAAGDSITGVERVLGSDHDDTLTGDDGANHLRGGAGDDTLSGDDNADRLEGGAGNDLLHGNHGKDTLLGGQGDDQLSDWAGWSRLDGGSGNDRLFAGAGGDTLIGGRGNDTLRGDHGSDRFVFRVNDGADQILDFETGTDQIEIVGGNFGALVFSQGPAGAIVDYGTGTVTLQGIDMNDLTQDDFVFS